MFKKRIISVVTIVGIGLLMSPVPFSYADSIKQKHKIKVNLTLDESLVDKPIEEFKKEDIIIKEYKDGKYIVIFIDENGNKKMQVITKEEAKELGYFKRSSMFQITKEENSIDEDDNSEIIESQEDKEKESDNEIEESEDGEMITSDETGQKDVSKSDDKGNLIKVLLIIGGSLAVIGGASVFLMRFRRV